MTIPANVYAPPAPIVDEPRRRALLLRLAAIREVDEVDQYCRPILAHDFGMTDAAIEAAVKRVREAL